MKSKKKKKKVTIKDIIRLIVLLVAFSVLLYPTFSSYLNEKNGSKVVSYYDEESVKLSKAEKEQMLEDARAYNKEMLGNVDLIDPFSQEDVEIDARYESLHFHQALLFANAITSLGFFSFLSDHSSATSGKSVARSLNPASTLLWEQYGQPVLFMVLLLTVAIHSCPNLHFHITFLCEPIDTSVGLISFFSDHSEANSGFNVLKSLIPSITLAPEHIGHFSPLERALTLVCHS